MSLKEYFCNKCPKNILGEFEEIPFLAISRLSCYFGKDTLNRATERLTADWLKHNDIKWLVLHNCAGAKKGSSK